MTSEPRAPIPIFRPTGMYWGFIEDDRLYDRYGRQMGWLDPVPGHASDVFDLTGRFLGELVEHHYVLRYALRGSPSIVRLARRRSTRRHRIDRLIASRTIRARTGPTPSPGRCRRRIHRPADVSNMVRLDRGAPMA